MIIPALLIAGGLITIAALSLLSEDGPVPVHEPDIPPAQAQPGLTRYKKVNAILGLLRAAAERSGIPLGLLVGWVARESGGRLDEVPKPLKGEPDGERGYFQLTPSESSSLGIDHARLSTDPQYSVDAGVRLIQKYANAVSRLGVAQPGSTYFWLLTKLQHTMGSSATQKIVDMAKLAGSASSWPALKSFALAHEGDILSATKHSPSKWFPLIDQVYEIGAPFGFGTNSPTYVVGALRAAFDDIPDPLDVLRGR